MDKPFSKEEMRFRNNHMDVVGFIPEMLGVYLHHMKEETNDLQKVYSHVMSCDECRTQFAIIKVDRSPKTTDLKEALMRILVKGHNELLLTNLTTGGKITFTLEKP